MSSIVPRSEAPGVDFCSVGSYHYIIRSDVGVFMRLEDVSKGINMQIYDLHYSCKGGDHYLASDGYFYIVKGEKYLRVKNMETSADSIQYTLHPNCQRGNYYLSMGGKFYIIYKDRGLYRRTTNMSKDEDAVEYDLHPSCKGGIYYWGRGDYAYFVKPKDEGWGLQYHTTSNMNNNLKAKDSSFSKDVVKFLPGGLAITKGTAFGAWKLLDSFKNSSDMRVDWSNDVVYQKGANRKELSSIEQNWDLRTSSSYSKRSIGELSAELAKYQLSLEKCYGDQSVFDIDDETWDDVTTKTQEISAPLDPSEQIFVWQFQLGLGTEAVLFTPEIKTTHSKNPPPANPFI